MLEWSHNKGSDFMATCLEYIDWRGDLSFDVSPLNEVDNYILCKIGCPDFTGIVPEDGEISFKEAIDKLYEGKTEEELEEILGPLASSQIMTVIKKASESRRFGDIILKDFVSITDLVKCEMFSALTVILPGGTPFVTYRGTGDTLISWKEDFLLCVDDELPAQADAVKYLRKIARKTKGSLVVGGHSKGGNLAIYASMKMPKTVKKRITDIYNNDGPGFKTDMIGNEEYESIRPKIHNLVSQHTIVGKLLYNDPICTIVHSPVSGIAAHDGFNWDVMGTQFVRCEEFSKTSIAFETALEEVMNNMDVVEKAKFIEEFFDILMANGAMTLSDINENRFRNLAEIGHGVLSNAEERKFIQQVSALFIQERISESNISIDKIKHPIKNLKNTIIKKNNDSDSEEEKDKE